MRITIAGLDRALDRIEETAVRFVRAELRGDDAAATRHHEALWQQTSKSDRGEYHDLVHWASKFHHRVRD